jgi:hypothetical protein
MEISMSRLFLCFMAFSAVARAQFGTIQVKWTCPKEGRFTVRHCEGCNPHYCMDGKHFHADEGPVPAWVLGYFAELKRKSEEIRREIDAQSAELRAAHAANVERSKQRNAKYASEQEALLQRAQARRQGTATRTLTPVAPVGVDAAPDSATPAKIVSTAEVGLIKVGDSREDVLARLGTPASAITIPGEDGTVETLSYRTAPARTARINIRDGRVVEIFLP